MKTSTSTRTNKLLKGKDYLFGKSVDLALLQTKVERLKKSNKKLRLENIELREARTKSYQINRDLAKNRDYWREKKIPKGVGAKLKFLIKNS